MAIGTVSLLDILLISLDFKISNSLKAREMSSMSDSSELHMMQWH